MNRTAVTSEFSEQESRAEIGSSQVRCQTGHSGNMCSEEGAGVERVESRRHQGRTNLSAKPSVGINLMCVKREGDSGPGISTPCRV